MSFGGACTFMIASALTMFSALLAEMTNPEQSAMDALMWSLMPIVGAFLASGMAFLLNKINEDRKAVTGRVIGALVFGVGIPRVMTYSHPWIKTMSLDPILLILGGFCCGLLGYAAAAYLVEKAFKTAPDVVDSSVDDFADRIGTKIAERQNAGQIDEKGQD